MIKSAQPPSLLWQRFGALQTNLEIADALILVYLTVFVRQYLWIVGNNAVAWALTAAISLLIWSVHLRTKGRTIEERTPVQFWLVVAAPLFVIYALRVPFPEVSFDILDYRLMNAERALRGFPFLPGDFFPARFPFNPAPDMVTGIARHVLGYRLGTVVNYLVMLWVGAILSKLLRPYIKSTWLRSFGVLLILMTEQVLFIINNYMVDLLALPLLLEATRLALGAGNSEQTNLDRVRLALFLGASVAFKLTNLAFVVPILMVYAYNVKMIGAPRHFIKNSWPMILAFLVPLLPFTLYIYWQTGSPVFPLYNKIFMSPFWPTTDYAGVRWGPVVDDPRFAHMKFWEVLLWPVLLPFRIEHTAGDLGRDTGRLFVGFICAFLGLLFTRNDRRARALCFITLLGAILWSAISGMTRYAIYVELLAGVIVLCLCAQMYSDAQDSGLRQVFKRCSQVLLWGVLAAQSAVAVWYGYRFEFGSRPPVFENLRSSVNESRYFLRDYSLVPFLSPRDQDLIRPVQAWIESSALSSAIQVQLKNDAPALCLYMPEYFSTAKSKERFAEALRQVGNRKMFALCRTEDFKGSIENITTAGLGIGRVTHLPVPYYSQHMRINMVLIEVLPPGNPPSTGKIRITEASAALPDDALQAELSWSQPPPKILRAGLKETVYVRLRNVSHLVWPALGQRDGVYRLLLGNHWLDQNNTMVINDDGRTVLLYDLNPGNEIELPLTITAPQLPGDYVLEIDMVQEGVTWFGLRGSKTLSLPIKVER